MVSVSVLKKIGIDESIGIGLEKFWYQKKYWYWFRKHLVSKKVSDSVFGIEKIFSGKKFRLRFRSNFGFRHTLN